MSRLPGRPDLRRRNALWRTLRGNTPGSPEFGAALRDLSALTGWDHPRLLAGLGLDPAELAGPDTGGTEETDQRPGEKSGPEAGQREGR